MRIDLIVLFALFLVNIFFILAMQRPSPAFAIIAVVSFVTYLIISVIFHPLIGIIGLICIGLFSLEAILPIEKTPRWVDRIFWPSTFIGCSSTLFILVEAFIGRLF